MHQKSSKEKYNYVKQRKYSFIHGFLFCWHISSIFSCLSCFFTLLDAFVPALNVLVTANFVDTALQSYSEGTEVQGVIKYLLLFIGVQMYSIFSSYFRGWIEIKFQQSIERELTPAVTAKYASLEYAYMDDPDTYALVNRVIGQINHFKDGFDLVCRSFQITVTLLSLLYIMFINVWWMIPILILSAIPMCFSTYKEGQKNYEEEKAVNEIWRRVGYYDHVLRSKDGYEERGLFSFVKNISEKWANLYKTGSDRHQKLYYKYETKNDFRRIVSWILIVICVALMCVPLKNGKITIGLFVSLIGTATTIISVLTETIPSNVKSVSSSKAYFRDYEKFCTLKEEQEALYGPVTKELPSVETIEFVDVSFRYSETSQWVLYHFSYIFMKEKHYAIVGENGAGKSTFVKLLLGLYTPQSGEILLNGTNLSDYPYSVRKALFGAVFQDYNTYALSMLENIKIGNIQKENEDLIHRIISTVGLESVAKKLENGYNTELGHIAENSVELSGGEWQRLAIARLLFLDPSVLLLDEPSASLDPSAENEIYRMFHSISQDKITILITHRLGAVHICDEILLVEEGKISESGSHDFLMNQNGKYANMYNLQADQYRS